MKSELLTVILTYVLLVGGSAAKADRLSDDADAVIYRATAKRLANGQTEVSECTLSHKGTVASRKGTVPPPVSVPDSVYDIHYTADVPSWETFDNYQYSVDRLTIQPFSSIPTGIHDYLIEFPFFRAAIAAPAASTKNYFLHGAFCSLYVRPDGGMTDPGGNEKICAADPESFIWEPVFRQFQGDADVETVLAADLVTNLVEFADVNCDRP